jgi:hypothetical protein
MHECLVRLCSSIWMHAFFQSFYEAVFLLQEMCFGTYPVSAKSPCSSTLVNMLHFSKNEKTPAQLLVDAARRDV